MQAQQQIQEQTNNISSYVIIEWNFKEIEEDVYKGILILQHLQTREQRNLQIYFSKGMLRDIRNKFIAGDLLNLHPQIESHRYDSGYQFNKKSIRYFQTIQMGAQSQRLERELEQLIEAARQKNKRHDQNIEQLLEQIQNIKKQIEQSKRLQRERQNQQNNNIDRMEFK